MTQNWKARSDPYSVAKLKNLISCLSIRRPKDTIELVPRRDDKVELEFSDDERHFYDSIKDSTLQLMRGVDDDLGGTSIFNVLRWVNQLRLVCNHGLEKKDRAACARESPRPKFSWSQNTAQLRFDHLDAIGFAKCSHPGCGQDLSSALSSELDNEHEDEPFIDEALMMLCSTCFADRVEPTSNYLKVCNHFPRQAHGGTATEFQEVFDSDDYFSIPNVQTARGEANYVSTKVRRIVQDLLQTPNDVKRFGLPTAQPRQILTNSCIAWFSLLGQRPLISYNINFGLSQLGACDWMEPYPLQVVRVS